MKKIMFFLICSTVMFSSSSFAMPHMQIGGDYVVPWRVDSPSGRRGMLAGGHIQGYLSEVVTADVTALFGVEDVGATDKPIYINPGVSLYLPTFVVQPYISANMPILVNSGQDIGIQGAGGLQLGIMPGLLLRYSIDLAYYFDAKAYIVNWVHAGVAVAF